MTFCFSCGPKGVARMIVRIALGLSLLFVGIAHYREAALYSESVGRGLGVLEQLGFIWGFILPALFIVGGVLLALGMYLKWASYIVTIGLASIPAGLMLKSALTGVPLDQTMPPAMNAFVWIIVLLLCIKGCGCNSSASCCSADCACACGDDKKSAKNVTVIPAAIKKTVKKAKKRK